MSEVIRSLIQRTITNDVTYEGLMAYFNLFEQTKNADHLLTLYNKEMDLCKVLQQENSAFTTLVYLYLNTLVTRVFGPGEVFRGMLFTDPIKYQTIIDEYQWARQNDNFVLETRVLQSTSKERAVAEFFIEAYRPTDQPTSAMLCHYHFPNKWFTVFDLQQISNFQDEA